MEISSLSYQDMVRIVAQYNTIYNGSKSVDDSVLMDRGYTAEQIAAMRNQVTQAFSPVESCGLRFKSDFSKVEYPNFHYLMNLYHLYEKGCLPFPGSVSEQPAQIMEMFSIIQLLELERLNREAKEKRKSIKK